MRTSQGSRLALLLLEGFDTMVAEAVVELERHGHPGVTPTHEFALRAIEEGSRDAASLGRRLAISRQAAAKTIAALEQMGYLERDADAGDARRKLLRVTDRGREMDAIGGQAFDRARQRWRRSVGAERADLVEAALVELNGGEPRGAWRGGQETEPDPS